MQVPLDSRKRDLDEFLIAHGIVLQRHEHAPVMTVEEAEQLVPVLPGAKTKNLFLRDGKGVRHFLVTLAHDRVVDLRALGVSIGVGRLGFASPERLRKYLGISPGSVSLLALCNDRSREVGFIIDRVLWQSPALQAHPLVNTATMVMSHANLVDFLAATGHEPRVMDLSQLDR